MLLFLSLGIPPKYRVQLQYFGMGSYRKKKRRGRTNLAELGAQWRLREHSTLSMGYRVLPQSKELGKGPSEIVSTF